MPSYRIGFGSDFTLKNQKLGVGTDTASVELDVRGTASFNDANLSGANLGNCDFSYSSMLNADLSGAFTLNANFEGALMCGVDVDSLTGYSGNPELDHRCHPVRCSSDNKYRHKGPTESKGPIYRRSPSF